MRKLIIKLMKKKFLVLGIFIIILIIYAFNTKPNKDDDENKNTSIQQEARDFFKEQEKIAKEQSKIVGDADTRNVDTNNEDDDVYFYKRYEIYRYFKNEEDAEGVFNTLEKYIKDNDDEKDFYLCDLKYENKELSFLAIGKNESVYHVVVNSEKTVISKTK